MSLSTSNSSLRVPDFWMSIAGKTRLSAIFAVENDLAVTRTFEFLEDNLVHARTRIDQRRRDDGERSALFDVTRGTEETLRTLQRVRIDTARQDFTGRGTTVL
jgi:hypothetical protein